MSGGAGRNVVKIGGNVNEKDGEQEIGNVDVESRGYNSLDIGSNRNEGNKKQTVKDVKYREISNDESDKKSNSTTRFGNVGRRLGSSSSSSQTGATRVNNSSATTVVEFLDQNAPSVPIQIRLADGTGLTSHFAVHQTIGDIRAFIDSSGRRGTKGAYDLLSGFPPKPLTDMNQTIQQASLANCVVTQKLK